MDLAFEPDPDFNRVLKVLLRQGEPDRVPFIELFFDVPFMEAVSGKKFPVLVDRNADGKYLFPRSYDRDDAREYYLNLIDFWYRAGFDYVSVGAFIPMPLGFLSADDSAQASKGKRTWINENEGVIRTREDLEAYPWPKPEDIDYWNFEFVSRNLPEGMKIIATTVGVLELATWLMGFTQFSFALMDDSELVDELFERIGKIMLDVYGNLVEIENVGAVWMGDDMGYKQGTMISPAHLREYVLPVHKRIAEMAHKRGLPYLLHSCGNLSEIMEDLIQDVQIDGKHSFEDVIMPVTEFKRQYGDRVATLGGIDMNILSRGDESAVRQRVRQVIEECAPGGAYALGSGNSVANYVKVENYLAMLEEGRKVGVYHHS